MLFLLAFVPAMASHITGGEMYYVYLGKTGANHNYKITLKLFQRCGSGRQFPNPNIVSIFNRLTNERVSDLFVTLSRQENIRLTNTDPCITDPPDVCYDVAYYDFNVSLPEVQFGYVLASQVNYRINGISNLVGGNIGATYTCEIPGFGAEATGPDNESAVFTGSDLVIVCANNDFSYSFAATDPDGDQLRYYFCEAYASTNLAGGSTQPTNPPPFPSVPYGSPFSANGPLGPAVSLNQNTGLISGIAPPSGMYVVTVCVEEIRNGKVIARQRKDLQINITDCNIASASLLPEYSLCKNTLEISLSNQSNSPLIVTTDWEFYDNANNLIHTANGNPINYLLPSPGDYRVKMIINRGQSCTDSTESIIHAFPGFAPAFDVSGICITKPSFFTDQTTSVFGTPNSWTWDFGELSATNDISDLQNPVYTYPSMGTKRARLIVTDTRGCRDTLVKNVNIIDKPPITLAFRDTLICVNDAVQLQASGSGIFSWTPLVNITNPNTATPTVSPPVTTTYYVDLDENGCKNRDSVRVNVVNFVTLTVMPDTTICRGDTIQLRVQSDGLQFSWTPVSQILDPNVKFPFVVTNNAFTDYQVTAVIGGCSATDVIRVNTVPYPQVNAGADALICYNATAFLNGSSDGSSSQWSPPNYVTDPLALVTTAHPPRTTDFVLTAYDTRGCPKPSRDTVRIRVNPKLHISAGADTAVVVNQPLQLQASGAEFFTWQPPTWLSAANIPDPIAIFPDPAVSLAYKVIGMDANGCMDSAYISIKVFKGQPVVFVPSGFTPNQDGRNDVIRPIAAGIKEIAYFSVYNRWGQLVFTTTVNGKGWDGRINGVLQNTGTFVWMVKAVDYTGKSYFEKGVFTLIR